MKRIVRTGVSLFAAAALVLTAGCSSQEKDASSKSKESQLDPKSPDRKSVV